MSKHNPLIKIKYLDGIRLKNAVLASIKLLEKKQNYLNKINIFPIPDRDTGTNMVATMNSVVSKIKRLFDRSISVMGSQIADSALVSAQGYSGIILAQFLNGFAQGIKGKSRISSLEFAQALQMGIDFAYATFEQPIEGTILTVIKDWSNHILKICAATDDFVDLLENTRAKTKKSLQETTMKLAVLKKAGVVDAGAQGFVYLLDGILNYTLQGKIDRLDRENITEKPTPETITITKTKEHTPLSKREKIGIVTDSSCDLPSTFLKDNQIEIIPLKISFGSETFLDKVEISPSEFYRKLVSSKEHPKTSQPALANIKKVYNQVVNKYDKILSIHLPRAVSGTLHVIEKAAQQYGDKKIICMDGNSISAALGLVIMEAIEVINTGASLEKIITHMNRAINNIEIFIILPTVKYLVKGGRLSKPRGFLGILLRLKPIVSFDQKGNLCLIAKAFGEKNALKKSLELAIEKASKYKRYRFMVAHANAQKKARWIVAQLSQIFQIKENIHIVEAAPVLGVHAGPGTVGFGFIGYTD